MSNLSGGFNQETLHEYNRGTEIQSKEEKRERNLMIAGLVITVGIGFMLLANPYGAIASVAFTAL